MHLQCYPLVFLHTLRYYISNVVEHSYFQIHFYVCYLGESIQNELNLPMWRIWNFSILARVWIASIIVISINTIIWIEKSFWVLFKCLLLWLMLRFNNLSELILQIPPLLLEHLLMDSWLESEPLIFLNVRTWSVCFLFFLLEHFCHFLLDYDISLLFDVPFFLKMFVFFCFLAWLVPWGFYFHL